jgi:hypothetical protein
MKIAKKFSWHAAAIAAAVLVSGAAQADNRDRGYRDHRGGHHDTRGGQHRRVWRDHGNQYYRYSDRGYRHYRYPKVRYYDYRPYPRYYGYSDYHYGYPVNDFGASLTFQFPLR